MNALKRKMQKTTTVIRDIENLPLLQSVLEQGMATVRPQRQDMNRSWAAGVSLTNAFLTELDLFQGRFIGCTNDPDMLDHALMRRMTLKETFLPLRERDRAAAYERELERFGGPLGEAERRRLSALEGLCLGDVGNVARHLELMAAFRGSESMTASHIVDLLEKEVRERSPASVGRIGFA